MILLKHEIMHIIFRIIGVVKKEATQIFGLVSQKKIVHANWDSFLILIMFSSWLFKIIL